MIFTHPRLVLDGRTFLPVTSSDSTFPWKTVWSLRLVAQSWVPARCLTDGLH
uniref:Uncharacterized protein n=1 Tax=Siphoviridae sp. ctLfk13 TaxID=2826251 RepID=A0A8S5N2M0_9CAUD|nr:MAG TPA: hypothetical protein [Siphoviridae sp. ctLfk13]